MTYLVFMTYLVCGLANLSDRSQIGIRPPLPPIRSGRGVYPPPKDTMVPLKRWYPGPLFGRLLTVLQR